MQQTPKKIYEFGEFQLDVAKQRLFQNGAPVSIRRKSYELLVLLVESAGELVEKEKILDLVWQDLHVEETNLTQHVYQLRRVLGDTTKDQTYIMTVPGKGYIFVKEVVSRFDTSVERMTNGPRTAPESENTGPAQIGTLSGATPATWWRRYSSSPGLALAIIVGLILIGTLVLARSIKRQWWRPVVGTTSQIPTIIPFVTTSLFRWIDF